MFMITPPQIIGFDPGWGKNQDIVVVGCLLDGESWFIG
jgi:hypothetical protein